MITVCHREGALHINGHAEKDTRCCAATGVLLWTLHKDYGAPLPKQGSFSFEYKESTPEIDFVITALKNLAETYPYEVQIK